jgi:Holliday junction resolvase RusA-like endonuclease
MTEIVFTVPGDPVGKQRPRFDSRSCRAYTPEKTVDYENLVGLMAGRSARGEVLHGPISMEVRAYFPIPKSVSMKRRKSLGGENSWHIKKPDLDNVVKAISDGSSGIAFRDDAQICRIIATKHYSEAPRVEVRLKELENA